MKSAAFTSACGRWSNRSYRAGGCRKTVRRSHRHLEGLVETVSRLDRLDLEPKTSLFITILGWTEVGPGLDRLDLLGVLR